MLYMILAFVMGVLAGCAVFFIFSKRKEDKPIGSLKVMTRDPDGPYLFLELSESMDILTAKKKVTMNVELESDDIFKGRA
jgi:hypothetical protein